MVEGLVTIIIPAYNVGKYIGECLESIQKQTYKNIEMIVVDDVSSDDTVKIVKMAQAQDSRIKLIQLEKNGGSALARQKGIDISRGEMITFVDADDRYCKKKAIEKFVEIYKIKKVDCVMFEYRTRHKHGLIIKKRFKGRGGIYTPSDVAESKACTQSPHWHYLWNKCFNGELLRSGAVGFRSELRRAQDVRFNADFLRCSSNFFIMKDSCFYEYNCANENQITKKKTQVTFDNQEAQFVRLKEELNRLMNDYSEIGVSQKAMEGLKEQFYRNVIILLLNNSSYAWTIDLRKIIETDFVYQNCRQSLAGRAQEIEKQVQKNIAKNQFKLKIRKILHV